MIIFTFNPVQMMNLCLISILCSYSAIFFCFIQFSILLLSRLIYFKRDSFVEFCIFFRCVPIFWNFSCFFLFFTSFSFLTCSSMSVVCLLLLAFGIACYSSSQPPLSRITAGTHHTFFLSLLRLALFLFLSLSDTP